MRGTSLVIAIALLAGGASVLSEPTQRHTTARAVELAQPETIQEIATDTLSDIAVAEYGEHGSVIYYNPAALEAIGPQVASFMMAHERGHLHLKHTRANALLAGRSALDSVLQGRELAADCYAARELSRDDQAAVLAAVRFFGRLGSRQFDAAHPPGAQRATKILSCMASDSAAQNAPLASH